MFFTRSRMLWGESQANAPSRFLDDLPDDVTERRSDELLSAFAWATESGKAKANAMGRVEPYRQHAGTGAKGSGINMEFNQDTTFDDGMNQDQDDGFHEGTRVAHPVFGEGRILSRRGDVVSIQFDNGPKKSFALSIAPLKRV